LAELAAGLPDYLLKGKGGIRVVIVIRLVTEPGRSLWSSVCLEW